MVDDRYGAPEADERGPIGGGEGYRVVALEGGTTVATAEELRAALFRAEAGDVIVVAADAEIDMTVWVRACCHVIEVPDGVTLAGNRGVDGVPGPLIYSDEYDTAPLIRAGRGARIVGLRLRGPDPKTRSHEIMTLYNHPEMTADGVGYYSFPTSSGIETSEPGLVVENCELSGWSNTAVSLLPGAAGAHVHHCDIHHCQRAGLGYGVLPHGADALIEWNRFDHMRHAIAGSGIPDTAYEARYNLHGPHSTSHCFDMHGSEENSVTVDGRSIAGEWIRIHHNTFHAPEPAAGIRAVPRERCEIYHNWFVAETDEPRIVLVGPGIEEGRAAFDIRDNVVGSDATPWEHRWETA